MGVKKPSAAGACQVLDLGPLVREPLGSALGLSTQVPPQAKPWVGGWVGGFKGGWVGGCKPVAAESAVLVRCGSRVDAWTRAGRSLLLRQMFFPPAAAVT